MSSEYYRILKVYDNQISKQLDRLKKRFPRAKEEDTESFIDKQLFILGKDLSPSDWRIIRNKGYYEWMQSKHDYIENYNTSTEKGHKEQQKLKRELQIDKKINLIKAIKRYHENR